MLIQGIPVIQLRETEKKDGYLYEAIKDGQVIATRKSVRPYVAALVHENSNRIANGVGRMDLLDAAIRKCCPHPSYIALQLESDPD